MTSSDGEALRAQWLGARELEELRVSGLDLEGADLSDKVLTRCVIEEGKLARTRWARATLEDCVLRGCDLTESVFEETRLRGVRFEGCRLVGVDWSRLGTFPSMDFERCDLRFATFVGLSLRKTKLVGCRLTEATIFDCDLTSADLSESDLTGARLEGNDLRKADLGSAIGAMVDPGKNQVKGARIALESAALLATSFGMKVAGHAPRESDEGPSEGSRRRRAR